MGNNLLMAILTATTCGATCWYAKEDICRCSCHGSNHGCMLDEDNPQPERTSKIDGTMYRLEAVGSYTTINNLAAKALGTLGWKRINSKTFYTDGTPYHYPHYANDKGSAIRVKSATDSQKKWPEVILANIPANFGAYLLWVQVPMPEPLWCDDPACERCIDRKFTIWEQNDPDEEIHWGFE